VYPHAPEHAPADHRHDAPQKIVAVCTAVLLVAPDDATDCKREIQAGIEQVYRI